MRRWTADELSGLAMLVIVVAVGLPVLFGAATPRIPRGVWAALFVVTVTALFWAAVIEQRSRRARFALAVAVGSSWAVVATAPAMGLLPILLVVTAAVSVYLVPVQVALTIVALNTVVLAASAAIPGAAGEIPLMVGFYLLIQFATVFGSVSLLREQRMRRELTETHVDLRAATVLLAESARTAERLRISRDLHDLIGHQLTVLALELEAARHRDGDGAHEHVERAAGVARALLSDVRNTVGELRAEPRDLADALHRVAHDLPGLDVSIAVDPEVRVGDEEVVAFVRALQEIVTNTLRHADARELRVAVTGDGRGTAMSAVDDGSGARTPVIGNGLRGLSERFEALGGEVTVDGSRGFRVTARVPAP
ncbi:sensor histidine kinase [Rhodococcus rhodochrous]|uniref:Histidine kinase n=1 Tax=Rhodococcus rhodochrous TaxID=1829 RepID=A0AAW4XIE4_RHORH|nr:histidine kinase [Rhodococcus rhodochrous]MCD2112758.1 histidine kinase [Rhodococcus rhodochrous]